MIRILVADDEALERDALVKILGAAEVPEPLQIIEAANGIEALNRSREATTDIAFLDIRMPGLDGLEVARGLAAFANPPEIVMITAYDHFTYAREALRFGVREYLLKPAAVADVLSAFQKCVRAVIDRREAAERQRTTQGITEDVMRTLKANIEAELGQGDVDSADLQRYVSLESPRMTWIGIALKAGVREPSSAREQPSVAARAFPRAFSALAQRYLIEDLGLSPSECLIFAASKGAVSGAVPEPEVQKAAFDAAATVLLILLSEPQTTDAPGSLAHHELLCRGEQLAKSTIDTFYARCIEAHLGALRVGMSVGVPESINLVLSTAAIALDLSGAHVPVLFLRPIQPHPALNEGATENMRAGVLSSRALSWLNENFMKSIGIETAAQILDVSPSHLSRVLKREIGLSFGETLARIRIARAKSLLLSGLSAKEASLLVGFSDQSYFTKVFLKIEGILPSALGTGVER